MNGISNSSRHSNRSGSTPSNLRASVVALSGIASSNAASHNSAIQQNSAVANGASSEATGVELMSLHSRRTSASLLQDR